jgi:protein-S-isoprenylcysteine O-methyltransferase Ste14
MRRSTAAIGSAAYFAGAAGTFAVLVPWLVTGWQIHGWWPYGVAAGALLIGAGSVPVVSVFVEFARAGGTPVPLAPTRRLVVSGFHRYVRNPVYLGIAADLLRGGAAVRAAEPADVRTDRVGGRGGVRPVVRGTCSEPQVRGRV